MSDSAVKEHGVPGVLDFQLEMVVLEYMARCVLCSVIRFIQKGEFGCGFFGIRGRVETEFDKSFLMEREGREDGGVYKLGIRRKGEKTPTPGETPIRTADDPSSLTH